MSKLWPVRGARAAAKSLAPHASAPPTPCVPDRCPMSDGAGASGGDGPRQRPSRWASLAAVLFWLVLNLSLNFYNKIAFQVYAFEFPVTMIMSNMFFSSCIYIAYLVQQRALGAAFAELNGNRAAVLALAFCGAWTVALENMSLVLVSLSLNQVIKSTMPIFMVVASNILHRRLSSAATYAASLVIVLGSILAIYKNPEANFLGVLFAVMSMALGIGQTLVSARLLDKGLSIIAITLGTTLIGSLLLFPIALYKESASMQLYNERHPGIIFNMMVGSTALASLYNLAHFVIIRFTSAIYSVVMGNFKVIILIFVSIPIFHTSLTTLNVYGLVITTVGFLAFNYVSYVEAKHEDADRPVYEDIQRAGSHMGSDTDESSAEEDNLALLTMV